MKTKMIYKAGDRRNANINAALGRALRGVTIPSDMSTVIGWSGFRPVHDLRKMEDRMEDPAPAGRPAHPAVKFHAPKLGDIWPTH